MNAALIATIVSAIFTYGPQVFTLVQNGVKAYEAVQQTAPDFIANLEKLLADLFPNFNAAALAQNLIETQVTAVMNKVPTDAWNPAVPR